MKKTVTTLCIIQRGPQVLLGMKKRGFGKGRWNGFGGKIRKKETIEEAAVRECEEESGVTPLDIKKRGIMTFKFEQDKEEIEVHFFSATKFKGEPEESEEMFPQWFQLEDIPFEKMWPDDRHWFPLFLEGKNFRGTFRFRGLKDNDQVLWHELEEVTDF